MKNSLDYFDAIYCINLDERTDRWERCQGEFEKFGIADRVERFPGIKGKRDGRWNRPVPWGCRWFPRPGAVGAAESHKAVIQLARNRGLNNVLVLEDDFVVLDNWEKNLNCALVDLELYDWNLFYLGYHLHEAHNLIINRGTCLGQVMSKKHRGIRLLVGVAYNSSIFDYLIENIDPFDWKKQGREGHVDKYFGKDRRLKKFYADPMILEPDWSLGTDIGVYSK